MNSSNAARAVPESSAFFHRLPDDLLRAASYICLPEDQDRALIFHQPDRWDELLDLDIPVFISHTAAGWEDLSEALCLCGLSDQKSIRLVEAHGAVHPVRVSQTTLEPRPKTERWCLVLGFTHPEEGWSSKLPLHGKRFVVTRQVEQAKSLLTRLEELGALVCPIPTIEFQPPTHKEYLRQALAQLSEFEWLIFTSPNGVRYFFEALRESELDHRTLGKAKFACIGPGTAKALKSAGFNCDLLPQRYVAEGLLEAFEDQELSGKKILIPRAQEAREVLPETLVGRGAEVLVAPVYQTVSPVLTADVADFLKDEPSVLFTSSSTVKNWVKLTENIDLGCYCIGPVTAATARELGLKVLGVAKEHTIEGLLRHLLGEEAATNA